MSYLCVPRAILSLAAVSIMLGGCGVYLHDEGLSNVAVEAREKAGALDLPSVIGTARDNRTALANKQVALLKRNAELQANIRLAQAVMGDGPMALTVWDSKDFAADLKKLGVKHNETLNALDSVYSDFVKVEFRLRSRARRVEVFLGIMPTPCLPISMFPSKDDFADEAKFREAITKDFIEAVPDGERETFKLIYADYVQTCNSIKFELEQTLAPLLDSSQPGGIAAAWNVWKTAEEDLEAKRAIAREKLVALKAAERNLSEASATGPDPAEKITTAADKLRARFKIV